LTTLRQTAVSSAPGCGRPPPGVVVDELLEGRIGDLQVPGRQAVGLELLGPEEALGDLDLLVLGVAVDADDLHAVDERPGDGIEAVGGDDEHDLERSKSVSM